jgi:hypothetical protein
MPVSKLHTRQYAGPELRPGAQTKVTGKHAIRAITACTAVLLAEWSGSGIAHADSNHEKQACALMDDYGTQGQLGEEPVLYALQVLSTEIPRGEAGLVIGAAVTDYCPNHASDLPPGWRH